MNSRKIFLGIFYALLAMACFLGMATAQNSRKAPVEPIWIKAGKLQGVTIYYDLVGFQGENQFTTGVVMYEMDEPSDEDSASGKKKAVSRVTTMVVDCKNNLYGVFQIQLYDVKKPMLKDKPFNVRILDPMEVRVMGQDSPLNKIFCPKVTT